MNEITKRFLDVVTYVTTNNIAKNKKDLAKLIGVSTSSLTEIFSGRSNVGIKVLQNAVLSFDIINADWLLTGKGEMLKKDTFIYKDKKSTDTGPDVENKYLKKEVENLKVLLAEKDKVIKLLENAQQHKKTHVKRTH